MKIRLCWIIPLSVLFSVMAVFSTACAAGVSDAVVKVFVTANPVDYAKPWQTLGSQASTGSGCIISGNRILTNAHVVADHTFIQVRKQSSPQKFTARVLAIGHDCDLALLTVDDPEFFSDLQPLDIGELPALQDSVLVIGFPLGGDKLSITKGVVSRIEIIPYAQSGKRLLGVQIDAAINPGNSGGPVVQDKKLVGVAMQSIANSQNIGFMIPTNVISHFLGDVTDGSYDGFPMLGIEYDNTENPALQKYFKIPRKNEGVLISRSIPFSPADQVLREEDVLLEIDGVKIEADATIPFRENERLDFSYLITQKQIGDQALVTVLRKEELMTIPVTLTDFKGLVVPPNSYRKPPYYIYGGLVFTVLSADLLQTWGKNWWERAPLGYLDYTFGTGRLNYERREEIVVLLNILPDNVTMGYFGLDNEVIKKVNGKNFTSFKEFVDLLEKQKGDFIWFETDFGQKIILSTEKIHEITQEILLRNNIPAQSSEGLLGR